MKINKPSKPTSNARASTRSGPNVVAGGIGSRNVSPQGVRNGAPAYGVGPGWASQLGSQLGNHSTEQGRNIPYKGEAMRDGLTPAGGAVPLGNAVALNVGKGGPGTGREVFKCGSQSQCGPTRDPNATGRDILSGFGPDTANSRKR